MRPSVFGIVYQDSSRSHEQSNAAPTTPKRYDRTPLSESKDSGRQSVMYETTQPNVVASPSHLLESRVIRPQLEEQPTCSQRQPNECMQGPFDEIQLPLALSGRTLRKRPLPDMENLQRKKAEQMAFSRRNEPEKRKKRLAADAERARLRRMEETEERRLERLAKDTERRKLRRSTETEEQRLLRLRLSADVRRKQRAQNKLGQSCHEEEFNANSREVMEENITANHSNVFARDAASVAFSTQEATPEADSLQHSSGHSDQRSMINFKADSISQKPSTFENEEFQRNVALSMPHLDDESAFEPLPSTSAYIPLKDPAVQPSLGEDAPLTPDSALRVRSNGALENDLNVLRPQTLPHYEHENMDEYEIMELYPNCPSTVLPNIITRQSPIQLNSTQNPEQRRRRLPRNLGIALTNYDTEENYLGSMNISCNRCGALFFSSEAKSRNGCFNICCNFGNISLDLFADFPELIRSFYTGTNRLCTNFREHIRSYNSALAMASMGAQIDTPRGSGPYCYRIHGQIYHYVGPATPSEGVRPQFGQVYILDTDTAAAERSGNPANARCDVTVMQQLTSWLHANNSYAASLKMMGDVAADEEQRAREQGRQLPTIRLIFDDASNLDRRRYNAPAANEIAVVYVGEDGDVPSKRALAIHHRGGGLQKIPDIDGRCDPLTYPLLFPRGGLGWHVDLTKKPSGRIRTRISQREFYSYLLAIRQSFSPLHHAGKLLQQFVVDAYVKIEQNRLNYTRTHQKELRIDSYRGLMDHLTSDNVDGPPGRRVILPSSFPGSPRAMYQSYQDAMSIVARYGKPDYFLTFTCNPQWREITENLHPGQTASDRPDLVTRVFKRKLDVLQTHLFEKKILGCVAAYVGIVEWQKRGLPHCHMLLIMTADAKPRTSEAVDAAVQAYLPSASENARLRSIVARNMIHRRCGIDNPTASCMVNGICSKRYPKDYRETTDIEVDGYPKYRRPNDGCSITVRGKTFDNRDVVPYNRYLLLLLNAHINLEICGYVQAVKYLYKYVYKGPDRASLRLLQQDRTRCSDEIRAHLDARYVCSPEALHHIFMYDSQCKSDTVCRLAVHLPDFQTVTFQSGEEREAAIREAARDSMLTAWFKLNNDYEALENENIESSNAGIDPRNLFYHQLPEHFTFVRATRKWKRRGRGDRQIGRMHIVPPTEPERFSLRMLLLHRKNMRSFEDLRTVEGYAHPTFLDAVRALGLLHDDSHYESCLEEAAAFQMPVELRALFSCLLAFCEINNPRQLYDRFKSEMAEDFIHRGATPSDAEALAYFDLYDRLQIMRYNLAETVKPPAQNRPVLADQTDYSSHEQKGREMYQCLNALQKSTVDSILASFNSSRSKLHFVDGPGGSGKTYLYNTVYHILKSQHRSVICVAWTGVAANLLPEGRTASSTFKLNMRGGNRECTLRREAREATPIKEADVIIWDEVSMVPNYSLKAVDRLLQDLMCNDKPFGGKIVVLGGDFRQVLPIVERGSESDMIDACLKNSPLWRSFRRHTLSTNIRAAEFGSSWCDFLLSVGNGEAEEDEMGRIQLPSEIVSNGNLIDEVFGDLLTDFDTLSERAILAPRNIEVDRINEEVLNKLSGQVHEYKSADDVISDDVQANEYTPEFLNSMTPAGLPPHNLRMKEGSIIMLLRNLNVRNGLCNGTRLIVTHFGRLVLGCRFASGDRKGKFTLIPRIDNYNDTGVPFRLRRTQFPVCLSFAMTINKAQGQSLTRVGISLGTEVFSHGQLYVALSRARTKDGVKVHKKEERVKNVVIRAVLN